MCEVQVVGFLVDPSAVGCVGCVLVVLLPSRSESGLGSKTVVAEVG